MAAATSATLPAQHLLEESSEERMFQSQCLPAHGTSDRDDQEWPEAFHQEKTQRATIATVLLAAAVLALLGPGHYCWSGQSPAEVADAYRTRSHNSGEEGNCHDCVASRHGHSRQPALHGGGTHVAEMVSGGLNGLLMMVACVLGGIGADLPGRSIFAMSSASLVAYSFSSGFGFFLMEYMKEEFALSQWNQEMAEVRTMPEEEVSEMVCHYRQRGLSEEDARLVAQVLSKYESFWVEHMMGEELGIQLPKGKGVAMTSGLATSVSVLLFGSLPLLGLASSVLLSRLKGPLWYRPQFSTSFSLTLSAAALLLLGVFVSRAAGSRSPGSNSLVLLVNGSAAALLALWLGKVCSDLCQPRGSAGAASPSPSAERMKRGRTVSGRIVLQTCVAERSPAPASPASSAASLAWPSFRSLFLKSVCVLWVGCCTIIVGMQLKGRMEYECGRVFMYGMLTCVTTGLGAAPFLFVSVEKVDGGWLAVANASAGGMMLAASACMLLEAHEHSGFWDWQLFAGLLIGALFIKASEQLQGGASSNGEEEDGEADVAALHTALVEKRHFRKAMLIFIVMFFHSAAEGVAVGVAFSKELKAEFGLYVSLLLAIHNVPEGLAVALVLVPRGVSPTLAGVIATLTSVPQPLLALAAFLFVDAFTWLLPLGLAFAAGAMVYVCLHELLGEAVEELGWRQAIGATTLSFFAMSGVIVGLQAATGA